MNEISLKTHYPIAELLKLKLLNMPTAHKNALALFERENVEWRKREGKGGCLSAVCR